MKYDIARIKDSLPSISALFERAGHSVRRSGSARFACCPFHEEDTPSCMIDDDAGRFHCFGCGEAGDAIDFHQKTWGTSLQETLARLASSHGISPVNDGYTPKVKPTAAKDEPIEPMTGSQLDRWHQACERLQRADAEVQRIAEWRGIDPACIRWAASRGLMGLYIWWDIPREAFLVEMPSPKGPLPVSVHIRLAPGSKGHHGRDGKASWNFDPKKRGAWPFIIGDPSTADYIFLLEGQWDALALVSIMGWHKREKWPPVCIIGLRGSTSGSKLLAHSLNPKARLFAIADADGAGAGWFEEN
ncbi:MAG: CHC2 zinc finger domain-containing protein, partial [Verrucomicrobiota bacterium]